MGGVWVRERRDEVGVTSSRSTVNQSTYVVIATLPGRHSARDKIIV
jgi:hypothetical protein